MQPADQSPDAPEVAPTTEGQIAREETLLRERDEALRERDEALAERDAARRDSEATERRVIAALAGDLAGLARRARAEYADRLGRGEGSRFEHLLHHAKAFEYVAVELAGKFGGEVAEAIMPPDAPAPEVTTPEAPSPQPGAEPEVDDGPSRIGASAAMIEID